MHRAILALLLAPAFAACLGLPGAVDPATADVPDATLRLPTDAYYSAEFDAATGFHSLEEIDAKIDAILAQAPAIAREVVIGESNEGRPLRAIVIENASVPGEKIALWYDGGHHANEVEGIEVTIAVADVLTLNYATNATIRAAVDRSEIWILPLVNPDGYVDQTRYNARYVNLNRNYDLDWGDPLALNTAGPHADVLNSEPFVGVLGPTPEYAGMAPFSEPESAAVRDATTALGPRLAFYLSHHTDVHCITAPWTAPRPPFPIPADHAATFAAVFDFVRANSEFGAGRWTWGVGECMAYSASGTSMDWAYATHGVPSFTFEVGGSKEREGRGNFLSFAAQAHSDLPHWIEAALPVELFFLVNAEALRGWGTEFVAPPLPEATA